MLGFFETAQALVAVGIVIGAASIAVQGGQLGIGTAGRTESAARTGRLCPCDDRGTRELRYRNFFYYSTLGLVFVVSRHRIALPAGLGSVIWAAIAVMMAWISGRTGWVSLSQQCTLLLLAAGVGSGLLVAGLGALAGDPSNGWLQFSIRIWALRRPQWRVCLFQWRRNRSAGVFLPDCRNWSSWRYPSGR